MHVSYEGGSLEDPSSPPDDSMFKLTVSPTQAPDQVCHLSITFEKGVPVAIKLPNGEVTGSMAIFQALQDIAGKNGVGRVDIVESRIVGMKSRGVYETPAATVLWLAHADLENLTLDGEVLRVKFLHETMVSELMYRGLWFAPEMEYLMAAIEKSQERVSGTVNLALYKGNCWVTGRESPNAIYDSALSSMDELGSYDQADAGGFIKILALRHKIS